MRRSATITLTLLAGAGLGLAYYNSGDDADADGVLESQAACVGRLGPDAAPECSEVFQAARATHAATAPRFDSADACRAATGADCTPLAGEPRPPGAPWASAAGSVFIPAMAGVMIGRALADGTRGATPVYAGGTPPACLPGRPLEPGCPPSTTSTTSSDSGGSGGGSRRYWYSGTSYAGSSEGDGRGGFHRASASTQGQGLLSRGAGTGSGTGSGAARGASSGSRAGGLGFSAAAHSGGGS